jgi:hypothetical protein
VLSELHAAIEAVCPIFGVADLGAGLYRIDYNGATNPEKSAAIAVVESFEEGETPDWQRISVAEDGSRSVVAS